MNLEKEILKLRIAIEKETNKDIKKILIQQKKHLEQMRKEVGNIYMKYSDSEGNLNISSVDRFNEMKKVEKNILNMRTVLAGATVAIAGEALLKSYVNSYYKTANIIDKGVSVNINYKILRPEFINAVINGRFENMTYSERIWKNTDWLSSKLYDVIGKGITDGTSIQKLSKEVKDLFGSSAYQSKRLVNTEMARVVSIAQDNIYQESGVVNKVMWVGTLDTDICDECASLDGRIFDMNDPSKPMPPIHSNDRCCYVPIVSENWNPRTRRDNITKENIPYQKYEDWKKQNNIS